MLLAGKARKGNEAKGTGSGKGKERFTKGKDTRGKERKGKGGQESKTKGKEWEGKGQGRKSKEWQRAERKGMFASRAPKTVLNIRACVLARLQKSVESQVFCSSGGTQMFLLVRKRKLLSIRMCLVARL